jgi:hypothetical protein
MNVPRNQNDDDWEDDEYIGYDDGYDEEDDGDSDEEPTVPCPACGREILEDTPRCPYCERYISAEDGGGPRRPVWIVVTALLCLAIAVWWVITVR